MIVGMIKLTLEQKEKRVKDLNDRIWAHGPVFNGVITWVNFSNDVAKDLWELDRLKEQAGEIEAAKNMA
jgi:hypothetical protein